MISEDNHNELLRSLSWVCGIIYALLFGISLAFQVLENYKNKSTMGYSTDYSLVSFIGFFFLTLNQTIGYVDETTDAGRVHTMDMVFCNLAFFCAACAYTQTMMYPSLNALHSTRVIIGIILSVFFIAATLETQFGIPLEDYCFFSLLELAAFIPSGSSLVKYIF